MWNQIKLNCIGHILSRSDLSYFIYVFVLVWSGRELGGLSMFRFLCCVCVWPGMVLNQRQVSLVVSDWGSYLLSLFPLVFRGCLFSVLCFISPFRTVRLSFYCFCFGGSLFVLKIKMNTYHAALCSSPSYDDRYTTVYRPPGPYTSFLTEFPEFLSDLVDIADNMVTLIYTWKSPQTHSKRLSEPSSTLDLLTITVILWT